MSEIKVGFGKIRMIRKGKNSGTNRILTQDNFYRLENKPL